MATEVTNDIDLWSKIIPPTIALLMTGLLSLIIGVYLEKFKNKITILRRKIIFQPVGTTTRDDYWGNIKILHNDRPVEHLNFVTVEIINDSNRDQPDLILDISTDFSSKIIGQNGFIEGNNTPLLLTSEYFDFFTSVVDRNNEEELKISNKEIEAKSIQLQKDIDWALNNKKFNIPVLNRKTKAVFNLLIENTEQLQPVVNANILKKSLKLEDDVDETERNKKTLIYTIIIGLLIFGIGFTLIYINFPNSKSAIILTGILGVTYSLFGLIILITLRYIKKIFN